MKTQGVVGNIKAVGTDAYYVALYGNYQPFGHAGADFKCPEGTPVHAIAAGTVLWADWGTNLPGDESNAGYRKRWYLYKGFPGIVTVIQHAGWVGVYAHLSRAQMNAGDRVTEGQVIGLSGGTGGVAPHLHVEALVDMTYRTGGGLIYGRTSPEPFFGSAAIAPQGSTTPASEEDELSKQAEDQIARVLQILEAQEGDRIRERIIAIDDRTATSAAKYLKGDQDATLYEFVSGKLRGITLVEWQATGQGYRTLPQDIINALPKEN